MSRALLAAALLAIALYFLHRPTRAPRLRDDGYAEWLSVWERVLQ